jgi:HEAT repeat protein
MAASYGEYISQQGKSFGDRIFCSADVDEALTKIENWRDDQGKQNDWSRCYIRHNVISLLVKALHENPELLTPPVWERIKNLRQHPEREVSHGVLNPLRGLASLGRNFADDVKDILVDLARNDRDPELRNSGIHLLYQIVSEYKDPAMIEEAMAAFTESLKDPNPGVRHIAQDRMQSLGIYDGVDPARVITLLAPMLKDPDAHVSGGAVSDLQYLIRRKLPSIELPKTGEVRAIFQAQAEGATGWRNRGLRKGVAAVTDTFDFISGLIEEARNSGPEGADKLAMFSDDFFHVSNAAKAIEYLAPLLRDERPAVQSWAAYRAKDLAYDTAGRLDEGEAARLRGIFQAQSDAAHWWERTVRRSNNQVLEAFDYRVEHPHKRGPDHPVQS